jgi:hypothetical protein
LNVICDVQTHDYGRKIKFRNKKEDKMKEEKKLFLDAIEVKSFTTTLDKDEQKAVKGGSRAEVGTTSMPIFC